MRTSILFVSVAALVVACSDQQQPTSPAVTGSSLQSGSLSESTVASSQGTSTPQAKPVDQVGFSKVQVVSLGKNVPAGVISIVIVECPAGTVLVGGGHEEQTGGTRGVVWKSRPETSTSWIVGVDNAQAGAESNLVTAWALCAS